jgi:hypothetical protein
LLSSVFCIVWLQAADHNSTLKTIYQPLKQSTMKKVFLILFAAGLMSTSFISCRENKTVADDIEDVADDVEDAVD